MESFFSLLQKNVLSRQAVDQDREPEHQDRT